MNSDNVEATPLKFRFNLSDEQVAALLALLEAEAVGPLYTPNTDGTFNVEKAIPLSKVREMFGSGN